MACYKFDISFCLVAVHNHFLERNKGCLSFVLVLEDVEMEPQVKGWL
jgi:hypothetical protein